MFRRFGMRIWRCLEATGTRENFGSFLSFCFLYTRVVHVGTGGMGTAVSIRGSI